MAREHMVEHDRVLLADHPAQRRQSAGGKPEINPKRIGVALARASAHTKDDLVPFSRGDDLFQQRLQDCPAAVYDARAAEVYQVGVGKNLDFLVGVCGANQRFILERLHHEAAADMEAGPPILPKQFARVFT